jgi:hypothetical protein
MTIPRDLSNLAPGANTSGVLQPTKGGTGATTLTGYVKGSGTSAFTASSTVPTSDLTGTLGVSNGGTGAATLTANNVLLGNGTGAVQVVAPGTNGNVLTSNGTTWVSQAAGGGGALIYLASVTASNAATADITTGISSTYDDYLLVVSYARPNTSGASLVLRLRYSGTFAVSNYPYMLVPLNTAAFTANPDTSGPYIRLTEGASAGSDSMATGYLYIQGANANTFIRVVGQINYNSNTSANTLSLIGGHNNVYSSGFDGVRMLATTGNITCQLRFYGITKS